MNRFAYTILLMIALLLPMLEWWVAARPAELWNAPNTLPAGQEFFLAAKLFGMVAIALTMLQLTLSSLARIGRAGIPRPDHRFLGTLILILALAHIASFVTAVSIRNGHLTAHLLLPSMFNGAYNRGVGMGVIAGYLLIFGALVPMLRWRRIMHRAVVVAAVFFTIHALWIGSEKAYVIAMATLGGSLVMVELWMRYIRQPAT